jgi:hypothetical protein
MRIFTCPRRLAAETFIVITLVLSSFISSQQTAAVYTDGAFEGQKRTVFHKWSQLTQQHPTSLSTFYQFPDTP